jgi:hypothetical protein
MKWLIAVLVAVLLAGYVYWQGHSVKTSYVNGLPPYTNLPGRSFILERDCYIFKFKHRASDWPLFAAHDTVPALPADVADARVGTETAEVRLLGVLRVGDHFRIASVRREQGPGGTSISFEVTLADESSRKYPRLDAYWIMDHSPEKTGAAPSIMTAYAVAIGKE